MRRPDYVQEGDEAKWGIDVSGPRGLIADYIPGTKEERVADGILQEEVLPPGTSAPEPKHGPRDLEADERSRTGATTRENAQAGGAVALTQPPAKNRGGRPKKADPDTALPQPEPTGPRTLEEALALGADNTPRDAGRAPVDEAEEEEDEE